MSGRWTRVTLLLSAVITAALLSASTSSAATVIGHDDQMAMFQSWVDAAAPLVPLPTVPVDVIQEPCPPEVAYDAYWCMDPDSTPTPGVDRQTTRPTSGSSPSSIPTATGSVHD